MVKRKIISLTAGGIVVILIILGLEFPNFNNELDKPVFKFSFGEKGSSKGMFGQISAIATDKMNNIYVADSENNRIQKFDTDGNFLDSFDVHGDRKFREVSLVRGITFDLEGNLLATLPFDSKVIKYNSEGNLVTDFGFFIKPGFNDIAVDSLNNIYVTGSSNNGSKDMIQKYDKNGKFINSWGTGGASLGQFSGITGIAIDSKDQIYAVDHELNRIQKFNSKGELLMYWGKHAQTTSNCVLPGQFLSLISIAIDEKDDIYVLDAHCANFQKFTPEGKYVFTIGGKGKGFGNFEDPTDITIDSKNKIYVTDRGNYRVQVFSLQ